MAVGFGIEIAFAPLGVALEDDDMGYIVSFDSQGGTFLPARGVITGAAIGALPTPPTRTGYTFTGWFTTALTGGVAITAETIPEAAMTAFARWALSTLPVGECAMTADESVADYVAEGSTKTVEISFTDEAGVAMIPDAVTWSLYNGPGSIVNAREDVSITPAATVRIVLSGLDHVVTMEHEARNLVVKATYTSSDGASLPLVAGFSYSVTDVTGI